MSKKITIPTIIFIILYLTNLNSYSTQETTTQICNRCGLEIKGPYIKINGKLYCETCYPQIMSKCDNCGNNLTEQYWPVGSKKYCRKCYEELGARCARCGQTINGKYWTVDNQFYCETCYQFISPICFTCGTILDKEYVTSLDGKKKFCKECYNLYQHCCNCGNPVGPSGMDLADGRQICNECLSTAIFDRNKIDNIFGTIKNKMNEFFGINVSFPIKEVKLVNKKELDEILKKQNSEYIPDDGVSGIHYYEKIDGNLTISEIYILTGLTPIRAIGVLTHEYTHAWQAENCPDSQDKSIREGFAEWTAYKVLTSMGYDLEAANMLKTSDPIYCKGLEKMLETEKKYGVKKVMEYAASDKIESGVRNNIKKKIIIKNEYPDENLLEKYLNKNSDKDSPSILLWPLIVLLLILIYIQLRKISV